MRAGEQQCYRSGWLFFCSPSISLADRLAIGEASNPGVRIMPLWSPNRISCSQNMIAKAAFEKNLLLILLMALYVKLKKDNIL